jgi:hypothetical protein
MRIALALFVTFAFSSAAQAAARVIVLPVVVGQGPEPSSDLMSALAKGVQDNSQWAVVHGDSLKGLMVPAAGLKDDDRKRIADKLEDAAKKVARTPAEAITAIEAVQTDLTNSAKDLALTKPDHDLAFRAAALVVAAHLSAKDTDKAKAAAADVAARFPARKAAESDKLPPPAVELLNAAVSSGTIKVSFKSRPEGCEVFVNGTSIGRSPAEIQAVPGPYQAAASCSGQAGGAFNSFPKRFTVAENDTARQEVLDADFERSFEADGGQRLRFGSSPERRQLEDAFARRVAERYGADVVVLASVGELSGADWLNGRLYLRSGYLNRQALVRLEPGRATALGRYLATGRETPGVLRPEEAGALVAASQTAAVDNTTAKPWYTDIVGWCFAGGGAIGVTLGLIENAAGNRTTRQADEIRGDSERQQALYREAQRHKFLGGIGLVGGGLMAITGVVLLAIPEYTNQQGELFVIRPLPGGGTVSFSGRF